MDLDDMATERLIVLSAVTGEAGLVSAVMDLARSTLSAVPSSLSLQIRLAGSDSPFTVTDPGFAAGTLRARSSLRLEIGPVGGSAGEDHLVVFLAGDSGAFGAFHDVPRSMLGSGDSRAGHRIERIVVDDDLPDPDGPVSLPKPGLPAADQRDLDRALGVLLGGGFTVEEAELELAQRAAASNQTTLVEARRVLRSLEHD